MAKNLPVGNLWFPQVTCERGLASMEESHMKMVEELQRRHQQEEERILAERDRLLQEESAATATGEEAASVLSAPTDSLRDQLTT